MPTEAKMWSVTLIKPEISVWQWKPQLLYDLHRSNICPEFPNIDLTISLSLATLYHKDILLVSKKVRLFILKNFLFYSFIQVYQQLNKTLGQNRAFDYM